MTEFDALLKEVLQEDANVQAPPGMERRVFAAIRSSTVAEGAESGFGPWVWAVAAMVLLGIAGFFVVRHQQAVSSPAIADAPFVATRVGVSKVETIPVPLLPHPRTVRHSGPSICRSSRAVMKEMPEIERLTIAPLTVAPIEVASLNFDTSTDSTIEGARR